MNSYSVYFFVCMKGNALSIMCNMGHVCPKDLIISRLLFSLCLLLSGFALDKIPYVIRQGTLILHDELDILRQHILLPYQGSKFVLI